MTVEKAWKGLEASVFTTAKIPWIAKGQDQWEEECEFPRDGGVGITLKWFCLHSNVIASTFPNGTIHAQVSWVLTFHLKCH